ncbi:mucin-5AC [Hyalella azteca]|uniref:Mucin-5AC n=1 Tax=Hyalella azteca TaxID=294128 RepID=A0A8B7NA80_HYAAZ|nr:mucin-5AC [Hyalella azteca]
MGSCPKLCLRWNNHSANLLESLNCLLSTEQHSDVTLACQGEVWRLHRLVLSASSSHFASLLADVTPGQSPLIIVDGPTAHDIAALVRFIYYGEVSVDQEHLPDLLKTASALKIKGLAEFPFEASGAPGEHSGLLSVPRAVISTNEIIDGKFPHASYLSSASSSAIYAPDEEVEPKSYPAEALPLNLSCKRDSYGENCLKGPLVSNPEEREACLPRSVPIPNEGRINVPNYIGSDQRTHEAFVNDSSSTNRRDHAFSKTSHLSESQPCILFPRADVSFGETSCVARAPSRYIVADSPGFHGNLSGLKFASGVIREVRAVSLPETVSTTGSQASPNFNLNLPSVTVPITQTNLAHKESSVLVLPQPPMKRLRTRETGLFHSPQPCIGGRSGIPQVHQGGRFSPCSTGVNTSQSSTIVPSTSGNLNSPIKRQEEYNNASQGSLSKGEATSEGFQKLPPKISSHSVLAQKFKFVPIKTELPASDESAKLRSPNEATSKMTFVKGQHVVVKSESIAIKTSPRSSTDDTYSPGDPEFGANPILSSAFLSNKVVPQVSPHSVGIPTTSPHKISQSSHVPNANSPSAPAASLPSSAVSNVFPSLPTDTKQHFRSKLAEEIELSADLPSQSSLGKGTDRSRSCSSPGVFLSQCMPSQCNSPSFSLTSSVAPATTTATSSASTSPGSSTVAAADGSSASSQRVSINMRTFKEEWRRQLLVDYDTRTNMSICMLCFTTFKSYDGPRKNTYVKHAKRFHPTLDKYDEHERDVIIQSYERQFKYDQDMQKEVNKTFKCGGVSSGATSGRLGKVWRMSVTGTTGVNASSGSSTGSGSLPGSRPDTDGEDDGGVHHLVTRRSESPDSDGSVDHQEGPPDAGVSSRRESGDRSSQTSTASALKMKALTTTVLSTTSPSGAVRPEVACSSPPTPAPVLASPNVVIPNTSQNVTPVTLLPTLASGSVVVSAPSTRMSFVSSSMPCSSTLVFANIVPCTTSASGLHLVTTSSKHASSDSANVLVNNNEVPVVGKIGVSIVNSRIGPQLPFATSPTSIHLSPSLPLTVPVPSTRINSLTSYSTASSLVSSSSSSTIVGSRLPSSGAGEGHKTVSGAEIPASSRPTNVVAAADGADNSTAVKVAAM